VQLLVRDCVERLVLRSAIERIIEFPLENSSSILIEVDEPIEDDRISLGDRYRLRLKPPAW